MALTASGTIRFSDLQTEFGGSNPISASEYYRGGTYVSENNTNVPTVGSKVDLSDFYSSVLARLLTYEVIGGGGGGGYGVPDGGSSGYAGSGGNSSISGSAEGTSISVTATGGAGGANGYVLRYDPHDGEASFYGSGGVGGGNNSAGGAAPSTSYGAGGGGGGGDAPSTFDSSGLAGQGGFASVRATGTAYVASGMQIAVVVGSAGAGGSAHYTGGSGAGGYVRLQTGNTVGTYTSGTHTFTVP